MANDKPKSRFWPTFLLGVVVGGVAVVLAMSAGWFDPKPAPKPAPTTEWGEFISGRPHVEFLEDGSTFRLLADFSYVDPRKKVWVAKEGAVVNGASIPRAFWTITGAPTQGRYRDASIIHDEGCRERIEPSDAVHLAFYEACRCGGLPEKQAKILYAAVYYFGPSWEIETLYEMRSSKDKQGRDVLLKIGKRVRRNEKGPTEPDDSDVKKLEAVITAQNPSLEEIRQLDLRKS